MNPFQGKVAVITGGASGIGRAVAGALVGHGATVVLADVNEELAAQTAAELGDRASSKTVDVRDAEAVQRLVDGTVADHGRIDLMFNNAGIAILGDVLDTDLEDWNRTLDVNLRGVVHGVMAAYPIMVEQGGGHIVNTASLAGLSPSPGLVAYAASKHAVVGLSTSLRAEAAHHGVRVSVVCPGLIETPLVENMETRKVDRQQVLGAIPVALQPADACARQIVKGVRKNKATIVVTVQARAVYGIYRLFPWLVHWLARKASEKGRDFRIED